MENIPLASIGIDVSKAKLDVACLLADQSVKTGQFENSRVGIGLLQEFLDIQKTAKAVPCVVESTGDYHLLVAVILSQAGFKVCVINPLITKQYQKSSIRQAKTDKIDAERLARIGRLETNLRVFTGNLHNIASAKLTSLLGKTEKTCQQLKASFKRFEDTKNMLGLPLPTLAVFQETIDSMEQTIQTLKREIVARAPKQSAEIAAAMKGVSTTQTAILFSVLSEKHFNNRDQLVAFVGLDVKKRQSGSWQGKEKLSKRGNGYLRKILYQIAWGLKTHNQTFKNYYERVYKKEKKHYTTTLIAIARKFLRFLYAYYWQKTICPQPAV
jgi:transposase